MDNKIKPLDTITLEKIHNALGFELTPKQLEFIEGRGNRFNERREGATTALVIKRCLDTDGIYSFDRIRSLCDYPEPRSFQQKEYFKQQFIEIWIKLKDHNIRVCDMEVEEISQFMGYSGNFFGGKGI